jgi:hypothetical protein
MDKASIAKQLLEDICQKENIIVDGSNTSSAGTAYTLDLHISLKFYHSLISQIATLPDDFKAVGMDSVIFIKYF